MAKKKATKDAARNSRETILANIVESNERLDAHLQQFKLHPPTDDSRLMAVGYWVAYPLMKKDIVDSRKNETSDDDILSTLNSLKLKLDRVHNQAVIVLMRRAEELGIESDLIWKSAKYCRDLLDNNPDKYGPRDRAGGTWPEWLGESLYELPPDIRQAILDGHAQVMRLNIRGNARGAVTPERSNNLKSDWPILAPQDMRKLFNIGQDVLRERLDLQQIPNVRINTKAYRVNPNCLPTKWETIIGRTPKAEPRAV